MHMSIIYSKYLILMRSYIIIFKAVNYELKTDRLIASRHARIVDWIKEED